MPFACLLSLPQIERVRWHLFSQLRIQVQGDLLQAPGPPSVKVMTMHSGKGLEFDTVSYLRFCELATREDDTQQKQQQVRVLYVAMTRALR